MLLAICSDRCPLATILVLSATPTGTWLVPEYRRWSAGSYRDESYGESIKSKKRTP